MTDKIILLLNPNSSASVTGILQVKLSSYATPGVRLKFTNPPAGPPSIDDPITSVLSAAASWKFMEDEGFLNDKSIAGIIVCCCKTYLSHRIVTPALNETNFNQSVITLSSRCCGTTTPIPSLCAIF